MKKTFVYFGLATMLLSACGGNTAEVEEKEQTEPIVEVEKKAEKEVDKVEESKESTEEATEVVEQPAEVTVVEEKLPTRMTLSEFNAKFKQDPEETQYQNGKFQLKDGSVVNADYLSYSENDTFDYAIAIFYEGNLADIQIETSLNEDELEKSLGVSFEGENTVVVPYKYGYEVTFDSRFNEGNIAIYPNEWD